MTPLGYRAHTFDRDHGRLDPYRDDAAKQNVYWVDGDDVPSEAERTAVPTTVEPTVSAR